MYDIQKLLENEELKRIISEYREKKDFQKEPDFNIFQVISDTYYKENLHSDIIAFLLNPNQTHKQDRRYLDLFIKYIQTINENVKINDNDFSDIESEVARENGRIDILIKDNSTKKAIIIENKINNATDTYRQLPKYVEYVENVFGEKRENCISAIVYLTLHSYKKPMEEHWTESEKIYINSKMVHIVAHNVLANDFVNGWLKKCVNEQEKSDIDFFLLQYIQLIKKIRGEIVNMENIEKFYGLLSENAYAIQEIRSLYGDLPYYLTYKIIERYKGQHDPFDRVFSWDKDPQARFQFLSIDGEKFAISVESRIPDNKSPILYKFSFYDEKYKNNKLDNIRKILRDEQIQELKLIENENKEFLERDFKFLEQEQDLYDFLDKFLVLMKEVKGKFKSTQ